MSLGLGLGLVLGILQFLGYFFKEKSTTQALANNILAEADARDTFAPSETSTDIKTLGILLLGYGGNGHDGGNLTDAIQVLYIDFEKSLITLISIPRDLWVNSGTAGNMKINNILAAKGAAIFKQVITDIIGLKMDYYLGVDFVGFERAIGNNMKGIEVDVGETLDDPWYPVKGMELDLCGMSSQEVSEAHKNYSGFELEQQFKCRYKHLHFEKGVVHMEGGDALEYVRSRHGSATGDLSRGIRQQEVLKAIRSRLLSLKTLGELPGFFNEIAKNTSTDFDPDIIGYLKSALGLAKEFNITTINLSTSNVLVPSKSSSGAFILLPKEGTDKWNEVKKYISVQTEKLINPIIP